MRNEKSVFGIHKGVAYEVPPNTKFRVSHPRAGRADIREFTLLGLTKTEAEEASSEFLKLREAHHQNISDWTERWQRHCTTSVEEHVRKLAD